MKLGDKIGIYGNKIQTKIVSGRDYLHSKKFMKKARNIRKPISKYHNVFERFSRL